MAKECIDHDLDCVTRELDNRLAGRIIVRLGLLFGWSLEQAQRALPVVLGEIGRWYEPVPPRQISRLMKFPLQTCNPN